MARGLNRLGLGRLRNLQPKPPIQRHPRGLRLTPRCHGLQGAGLQTHPHQAQHAEDELSSAGRETINSWEQASRAPQQRPPGIRRRQFGTG
jgi:hypothetical protein